MDRFPRLRRKAHPAPVAVTTTTVVAPVAATGAPPTAPAVPIFGAWAQQHLPRRPQQQQQQQQQPPSRSLSSLPSSSQSSSGPSSSGPSSSPAPASSPLSFPSSSLSRIRVPPPISIPGASASSPSLIPIPTPSPSATPQPLSSLPKSLRTLRLLSAKRARSPQMAQTAPPPVAVVHHEPSSALEEGGVLLTAARTPGPATDDARSETLSGVAKEEGACAGNLKGKGADMGSVSGTSTNSAPPPSPLFRKRRIPAFLNQSVQDLVMQNFYDLQYLEAERSFEAAMSGDPDHRWGTFAAGVPRRRSLSLDRYTNIRPWNHNRVRLRVPPETVDYVNASYVGLDPSPDNRTPKLEPLLYVAMQGPMPASVDHVWRMVVELAAPNPTTPAPVFKPGPVVIVQLSRMVENDVAKCHPYFPSTAPHHGSSAPLALNKIDRWRDGWSATLTFDGVEPLEDGAIEKTRLLLHVASEEEPRVVWHLLFRRWPDFGVPADGDIRSFFTLMRLSRELNTAGNRRIIHCSAGVGRTGTFIALEHLMRELNGGSFEWDTHPPPQPRDGGTERKVMDIDLDDGHDNSNDYNPGKDQDQNHSLRISTGGVFLSPAPPPPSPPPPPPPEPPSSLDADPVFATINALRAQRKQMVQADVQFVFVYSVLRNLWLEKYWGRPASAVWGHDGDGSEPARKRLGIECR